MWLSDYFSVHTGSALRSAGGPSFDAAVKEVSDKTSLSMGEGQSDIEHTPVLAHSSPLPLSPSLSLFLPLSPSLSLLLSSSLSLLLSSSLSHPLLTAAISGSGTQLPCKFVIHVYSPTWGDTDAVPNLEKSVKNCLTLAENKNLSTVAFPSIASGS